MFDKICAKSWVMAAVVAVAATLLAGHCYAARTVTKAVTVQRGNKTVAKTVTKTRGRVANVSAVASVGTGVKAQAQVGFAHNNAVALSHNGFAVFNTHNFHNRAVFIGHNYNSFAVGHGYNTFGVGNYGYNAVQVVQPVTVAVATPLTVATATLPVEIVNAPAVAVAADPCATTTVAAATYAAPAVTSYATQKVIQVQKVTSVAVPLDIVGVKTVGGY